MPERALTARQRIKNIENAKEILNNLCVQMTKLEDEFFEEPNPARFREFLEKLESARKSIMQYVALSKTTQKTEK